MKRIVAFLILVCILIPLSVIPASASEQLTENQEAKVVVDRNQDSDGDGIVDLIEEYLGSDQYSVDTDGDGVSDYVEFHVTHTDVLISDGNLDTDNDGLTNAEEMTYNTHPADPDIDGDGVIDGDEINIWRTNPLAADTDNDGLKDGLEINLELNPLAEKTDGVIQDSESLAALEYYAELEVASVVLEEEMVDLLATGDDTDYDGILDSSDSASGSNSFSGKLYTDYATSSVSYNMDYRWFFSSATTYNAKLAVVSSLASSNVYATNHMNVTSGGTLTTTDSNSMTKWMQFHGMTDVKSYNLTSSYTDNHVSEMYIGRREVTYGGTTKNIICVVIRGTNSTLKEWSSNFDLGSTSTSASQWTTTSNHKGFDITSNRLNTHLNSYITTYCSGKTNVLWITGHSRGAALANIIAAKQIDAGRTVFAYTFATPNTTTSTTATASKYKCIFNIINSDDFVPNLPMSAWGFKRYGVTKSASIANSYETAWESLTGIGDYNPDTIGMQNVVDELAGISTNRNNCYVYVDGTSGRTSETFTTATERNSHRNAVINSYPTNVSGTYKVENTDLVSQYMYYVYQQPAFLMQTLAAVMGNELDKVTFATLDVAPYLESAKLGIIASSISGIEHPHYTESYYLLATKLS